MRFTSRRSLIKCVFLLLAGCAALACLHRLYLASPGRPSRTLQIWLDSWAESPASVIAVADLPKLVVRRRGHARMRLIPAGQFDMGRAVGEDEAAAAALAEGGLWHPITTDIPRHRVVIAYPFYMDETEVIDSRSRVGEQADEIRARYATALPLGNYSWLRALRYCEWAGGDLPWETEWEYAARGGVEGLIYPWGNEDNPAFRNGLGDADGFSASAPVASYPPNGFGLYDMSGNVSEWCLDIRVRPYESPASDAMLRDEGAPQHLIRGGNWASESLYLRSSHRGPLKSAPRNVIGFRVVVRVPLELLEREDAR